MSIFKDIQNIVFAMLDIVSYVVQLSGISTANCNSFIPISACLSEI